MDTYFFEIQDAPGEIYDIEDLYEDDDNEEKSFNQFLNSNYDFWSWHSLLSHLKNWMQF